jgi:Spirocyclase AveC-like
MAVVQEPIVRQVPADLARKSWPVQWWAVVGAGCVLLTAYEWLAWLAKGHAHSTPMGPSRPPTWMKVSLVCWQVVFLAAALGVVYWFIVRPWRRERRLTFDGMFVIAWFFAWAMQDSWFNYTSQWFNYNSRLINLGCPQCEVPGWVTPRGNLQAEPFFVACLYVFALFGGCLACNAVMRAAKHRWSRMGTAELIGVALATMALADLIAESIWSRTATYSYVGAPRSLSIGAGHWYQFPVSQMLTWGGPWALIACIRYFRNDRGETIAERGTSQLAISQHRATLLRLLAVIGAVNLTFFVFSNIPNQISALNSSQFPRDTVTKSYFTNMMCGPGTPYACSGPRTPIARPRSAHLTPAGGLAPAGVARPARR